MSSRMQIQTTQSSVGERVRPSDTHNTHSPPLGPPNAAPTLADWIDSNHERRRTLAAPPAPVEAFLVRRLQSALTYCYSRFSARTKCLSDLRKSNASAVTGVKKNSGETKAHRPSADILYGRPHRPAQTNQSLTLTLALAFDRLN